MEEQLRQRLGAARGSIRAKYKALETIERHNDPIRKHLVDKVNKEVKALRDCLSSDEIVQIQARIDELSSDAPPIGLAVVDQMKPKSSGFSCSLSVIVALLVERLRPGACGKTRVLPFPTWPYGRKRVVVLSSRALDLSAARGAVVEQMAGEPADIVAKLAANGAHHLYVDGGVTIQRFLRAGLIQRIITRVPVLIGEGIPLFGKLPHDIRLRHVATRHYASGLVQTEYGVGD